MDAAHSRRVVQRGELAQGLDLRQHGIADQHRRSKQVAAMHDAVAHRVDFDLARSGGIRQAKAVDDQAHSHFMIRHGQFFFGFRDRAGVLDPKRCMGANPIDVSG